MSSSFTTYRSPFLILCYSWEALESGKGLNIRVNGVILHFDMPHIISPSISLLAEECGDFLPPCISSPHPFALSSCHNVVQVGRHSGWTDCTIPSNSLIFKFIYWLSFVQQWWATTAWGDGRKKKSREQVDGGRLFMTNWCCTALRGWWRSNNLIFQARSCIGPGFKWISKLLIIWFPIFWHAHATQTCANMLEFLKLDRPTVWFKTTDVIHIFLHDLILHQQNIQWTRNLSVVFLLFTLIDSDGN